TESSIEKSAGRLLVPQFFRLDETVGEARAFRAEPDGADHPVAVEPVFITGACAPKSRRTVDVISSPQPFGNLASPAGDVVGVLNGVEQEAAFQSRAHTVAAAELLAERICSGSKR